MTDKVNKKKIDNGKKNIKKGDIVYCKSGSLPFGRGGKRKVLSVSKNHSIYVELTIKDSAYQNKEPHQDFWQVMWNEFNL